MKLFNTTNQAAKQAKEQISDQFLGKSNVVSVGTRKNNEGFYVEVGFENEEPSQVPSSLTVNCEGKEFCVPIIKKNIGPIIASHAKI